MIEVGSRCNKCKKYNKLDPKNFPKNFGTFWTLFTTVFDPFNFFNVFAAFFSRSYSKIKGSKTVVKRVQKVPKFFWYQNRSMKSLSYCYHVPNMYSFKIAMNDVLIVPFVFHFSKDWLENEKCLKMKFQKIRFFKTKL